MKKQNKKIFFVIWKRLVVNVFAAFLISIILQPLTHSSLDNAIAEELGSGSDGTTAYPYIRTFTISAYYSPLPCQNRYTTGSYEGDIKLNGRGVRGADGTGVYPGMVAAPRTFEFGTKMEIPGIGIVAVHDRGGAIVASNGQSGIYDRLDIWMGYGDKGLARALNWGKRSVDVIVYGLDESVTEAVTLGDYSSEEANATCNFVASSQPDEAVMEVEVVETVEKPAPVSQPVIVAEPEAIVVATSELRLGSFGSEVEELQGELKNLNFYHGEITGYYGPVTQHAVYKFQQSQFLVANKVSLGAGIFGPKTRERMQEIIYSRRFNTQLVAVNTANYQKEMLASRKEVLIASELGFGMTGAEVTKLQKFLRDKGYFDGVLLTEYFGPVTKSAVMKFQKANKLITSETDPSAGLVDSATLELINVLS